MSAFGSFTVSQLIVWMTMVGFATVDNLDQQEISSESATKHGSDQAIVVYSYSFEP